MRVTEWTDKWIAALRSGKYPQGKGRLCVQDQNGIVVGYCCLGVAAAEMDVLSMSDYGTWGIPWTSDLGSFCSYNLPTPIARDLGLTDADQDRLTRMNDSLGWTFGMIADAIEVAKTTGKIAIPGD